MKLFGFNITRRSAPQETTISQLSPAALAWLQGSDAGGQTGPALTNAYEQVVWVYRAINVLAEQIANIPFLFSDGERGRENLITSGPLLDFYARPHPHINRFQYWELRVMWLMLRGECFRIPIYSDDPNPNPNLNLNLNLNPNRNLNPNLPSPRSTLHAPRSLRSVLILDPANFHSIIQDHQLLGWRYSGSPLTTPLESQVLLPEEVWFEKLPNPFDFWRGLPPLHVAALAAKTDFSAASFMRGFLENNADNGLIVRTDEHLDDEQRAQIYAALRNRKRRAGCADTPLLLSSTTEVVQPQLSSADLQFLENRKFSRAEICAAFGVPEEIVATTDHNKYDVMQGARLNFIENRVAPLCARLEASENATTIPAIMASAANPGSAGIPAAEAQSQIVNRKSKIVNSATGWFDLDSLPIMQQARRNRLSAAKTGFDMGVPFNELNRVLDLGFRPLPHGDIPYLPKNLQAVEPPVPSAPLPSPPSTAPAPAKGNSAGKDAFHRVSDAPASPPVAQIPAHELLPLARQLRDILKSP